LVVVAQDPDDRRSRRLSLTREGTAVLARALPIWEQTHRDVEAMLPGSDLTSRSGDSLADYADRLRSNLRALA